jgi:hypothetical protein
MKPKRTPPANTSAALYVEQMVDDWIRATIRGEPWVEVQPEQPVFIRKREVLRRVGLSDFTVWHLEQQGRFPRRLHVRAEERADAA